MSLKRELNYSTGPTPKPAVVHVSEVMKQIEVLSSIRKRIREGYYDRPEILSQIAEQLSRRVNS